MTDNNAQPSELNMKVKGFIFYNGPSVIDSKPIVGIATLNSKNAKTGNLIQTWIIRSDIPPVEAIHNGGDESICGGCPLRGYLEEKDGGGTVNRGRSCYVNTANSVNQVYRAYQAGRYLDLTGVANKGKIAKYVSDRKLRLGAYGDPVAIPLAYWKPLLMACNKHTGYTHQWKNGKLYYWRRYLMASTHSRKENEEARNKGWRTFRTALTSNDVADDEIVCPASEEAGKKRDCITCMACSGVGSATVNKKSVVIALHGSPSVMGPGKRFLHQIGNPR